MLFAINKKYWNIEEGTIGWNELTAFIPIPTIKGISTNFVMGLLHLNLRKCRPRDNVIISHDTLAGKKKKAYNPRHPIILGWN